MNRELTATEFEEFINQKNVIILDVRENYEYSESHLKDAKLVPASNFWKHFEDLKLNRNSLLALYCHTGSRSSYILNALLERGYKNVVHLERGIIDWYGQGKELIN